MGVVIKASAVRYDSADRSSISLAAKAAKGCIQSAGIDPERIDLMINVGVIRDNNMVEPSMAALIQKDVGLNLDFVKHSPIKAAFSFDLMNGPSGVMNAIQVAGAFLKTGKAEYILVVSSDTHPSNKVTPGFPYASVGGALLLERGADDKGFGRVHFKGSSDGFVGAEAYVPFGEEQGSVRHHILVTIHPEYEHRLLELVELQVKDVLAEEGVSLDKTLLVTPQITKDFAANVAKRLGVSEKSVVNLRDSGDELGGDPHSSAMTFGYHTAVGTSQIKGYDRVLFVAGGAGLTSACSLYTL